MLFVGACSKKVGTEIKKKEEAKIGPSFEHIPRVEIVKKIEPFLQKAISEKWNKQAWIDKFGNPWRNEIIDSTYEFIEYSDRGPFKASGKELITGVIIKLRSDITYDHEFRRTTFGLPSHLEIDSDGRTKLKQTGEEVAPK